MGGINLPRVPQNKLPQLVCHYPLDCDGNSHITTCTEGEDHKYVLHRGSQILVRVLIVTIEQLTLAIDSLTRLVLFCRLLQHLPGFPASPPWVRVEGKHWRRRRLSPPPPPRPCQAPTPPTSLARAPARRTRPFPNWRTSSWISWTKSPVSVFIIDLSDFQQVRNVWNIPKDQ